MTVPRLATDDGNCITRTATPNRRMLRFVGASLEQKQYEHEREPIYRTGCEGCTFLRGVSSPFHGAVKMSTGSGGAVYVREVFIMKTRERYPWIQSRTSQDSGSRCCSRRL